MYQFSCQSNVLYYSIHKLICIILDYKNLKFKHLIDDIIIDLWSSRNIASMEDIRIKYNPMIDLLKFTSNKKILSEFVVLGYNQICN